MKTIITSNSRSLRRALCTLLLCIAALWTMPGSARAQLYVAQYIGGTVGEYNATTGAAMNPTSHHGAERPLWTRVIGQQPLRVGLQHRHRGRIQRHHGSRESNFTTITGLRRRPTGLALSGNNLFVANFGGGTVGEYNATTGADEP